MATDLPDFGDSRGANRAFFGGQARFVGPISGIGSGWLDRANAAKWVVYTLTIRTSKQQSEPPKGGNGVWIGKGLGLAW